MIYFAYGSNMSSARLRQRVPSAQRLSVASLTGHRLCFHKVGRRDGSAKCDAYRTGLPDDRVWGVVYLMDSTELSRLDRAEGEGQGYARQWVEVDLDGGESRQAFTYLATLIDQRLKPFTWYKRHVLAGATENALPAAYIRGIEGLEAVSDPDLERHRRESLIHDR